MLVGLMRHGKAEPAREGVGDEERRLTPEGRRLTEDVARILPWRPRVIYTSPLRRAVETAEIVAGLLGGVEVHVAEELRPDRFNAEAFRRLAGEGVLMVGHAPSVEETLSALTGCRAKMKTSSIAIIDYDPSTGTGRLLALLVPPTAELP